MNEQDDEVAHPGNGNNTSQATLFRPIWQFAIHRYKDGKAIIIALREAHAAGTLNETQELLFAPTRPEEELYDLENDPFEIHNLAADPEHQTQLKELKERLDDWMRRTNDHGPESEAMYDSDMAVYLKSDDPDPGRESILKRNIALMKQWAAEGK